MSNSNVIDLEPGDVKAALDKGEAVLIDVREAYEFGFERIQGALLFPLATFDPAALPTGGKTLILQCGTGRRSGMAAEKCLKGGMAEMRHMKGGINAWKQAELPTIGVNPATGAIQMNDNKQPK